MEQGEIILYQPNDSLRLEVRLDGDNVWLNRSQLAELFDRDVKTIGKHINNALKEELDNVPVVAKFATTAADGKVYQTEHYNLDMVISVGFRVKSRRGVDFRRWANTILKEYMLKGYMNPQPAPTHEGSTIENITRYIKDTEKEGQLAGRTIVSDWDDNGVKKQAIVKYNHLGHIILYDSWWNGKRIKKEFEYQYDNHNNWVECKEYHDGNYVNLHLCQYKYK